MHPISYAAIMVMGATLSVTFISWLYGMPPELLFIVFAAVITHTAVCGAIALTAISIGFGKLNKAFQALK